MRFQKTIESNPNVYIYDTRPVTFPGIRAIERKIERTSVLGETFARRGVGSRARCVVTMVGWCAMQLRERSVLNDDLPWDVHLFL